MIIKTSNHGYEIKWLWDGEELKHIEIISFMGKNKFCPKEYYLQMRKEAWTMVLEQIKTYVQLFQKEKNFSYEKCIRPIGRNLFIASQNPEKNSAFAIRVRNGEPHWKFGWIYKKDPSKTSGIKWLYSLEVINHQIKLTKLGK